VSEEMNVDLLVMASSKNSSLIKKIVGSTVRRVIDNVKNSVLIVHESHVVPLLNHKIVTIWKHTHTNCVMIAKGESVVIKAKIIHFPQLGL
jgi:hypothetical protein